MSLLMIIIIVIIEFNYVNTQAILYALIVMSCN